MHLLTDIQAHIHDLNEKLAPLELKRERLNLKDVYSQELNDEIFEISETIRILRQAEKDIKQGVLKDGTSIVRPARNRKNNKARRAHKKGSSSVRK